MSSKKVILITGSGYGIGAGAAEAFAQQGYSVVVTGRNQERVMAVLEKCKSINLSVDPLGVVADLTVAADRQRLIDETLAKYGRLDVLVNNAGACMLPDMTMDEVMAGIGLSHSRFKVNHAFIMATNLTAPVELTRLAAPHLIKTKGCVINVSATSSTVPDSRCMSYCMTKAGLDMFTKCASLDLAKHGVRVNAIRPGAVQTDEEDEDEAQEFVKLHPIGRVGHPQDVANLMLFMASDAASWMTGECVRLDGGFGIYSASQAVQDGVVKSSV